MSSFSADEPHYFEPLHWENQNLFWGFFPPLLLLSSFFLETNKLNTKIGQVCGEGDAGGLEFAVPWSFGIRSVVASFVFQSLIVVAVAFAHV